MAVTRQDRPITCKDKRKEGMKCEVREAPRASVRTERGVYVKTENGVTDLELLDCELVSKSETIYHCRADLVKKRSDVLKRIMDKALWDPPCSPTGVPFQRLIFTLWLGDDDIAIQTLLAYLETPESFLDRFNSGTYQGLTLSDADDIRTLTDIAYAYNIRCIVDIIEPLLRREDIQRGWERLAKGKEDMNLWAFACKYEFVNLLHDIESNFNIANTSKAYLTEACNASGDLPVDTMEVALRSVFRLLMRCLEPETDAGREREESITSVQPVKADEDMTGDGDVDMDQCSRC